MKRLLFVFVLLFVLVGCGGGAAETPALSEAETAVDPTPIPPSPTDTPIPPTPESEPTAVPPTDTPLPPTAEPEPAMPDLASLEEALQSVVDAQVEAGFPSVVLMVDVPDLDFTWQGAGGMADAEAGISMEADTPFRLASISKMMIAAVMLRLAEEGMLDLDDPISLYLETAVTDLLNGPDGESYGEMIAIRQLLNHTSGVADYFSPTHTTNDGPEFYDIFVNDPDKIWEPVEVITFAADNVEPQFAPGESWDYSNTNFIFAGLIIEEVAGMSLGDAYEEWLFGPLGMTDTFFAEVGDSRLENVSHAFNEELDVSGYASLSWQWGLGGVVSTAGDLTHFMRAWVEGEIFTDPASKEAMVQWTSMAPAIGFDGLYYGLGMVDIDFGAMGSPEIDEIMGHNGMWNSFVYYWPKHNVVLSGTLNQAVPMDAYTGPVMMTMQTILAHVETE
ncbi:MAG: beta-lactamase family protein [Chloroflexi bacterium]|nr:beta-lactamase family protein [Chloroflexota bacterium]